MKPLLALLTVIICATQAQAQSPLPVNDGKPIELSADEVLEWHRDAQYFIARGNVHVVQDKNEIFADTLRADYTEKTEGGGINITLLTASDNVRLVSEGGTGTGDKLTYDTRTGAAELTGDSLRLENEAQVLTATDRMTYNTNESRFDAYGRAKIDIPKEGQSLTGDQLTAYFKQGESAGTGTRSSLDRVVMNGNVVIRTPDEIAYGKTATYTGDSQVATLAGNVRIERGQDILTGDRAEVNLKTNISKMFGNESGGRVKGVFYSDSTALE